VDKQKCLLHMEASLFPSQDVVYPAEFDHSVSGPVIALNQHSVTETAPGVTTTTATTFEHSQTLKADEDNLTL
jgi:hypothetical protein